MKRDVYEKLIKCHINGSSKYTGKVKCIIYYAGDAVSIIGAYMVRQQRDPHTVQQVE